MSLEKAHCTVCFSRQGLAGVVVAGEQLLLCVDHAAQLASLKSSDFNDLGSFFVALGADRRGGGDRRERQRRMFPPRPEGRRHDMGRRCDDPEA